MVKSTDLSDDLGFFVETRSPADVNIMVSVPGRELERMRLHVILVVGISPGAGTPSASTVDKL